MLLCSIVVKRLVWHNEHKKMRGLRYWWGGTPDSVEGDPYEWRQNFSEEDLSEFYSVGKGDLSSPPLLGETLCILLSWLKDKGRCYIQDSSYEILFAVCRVFQIAVRGGGGESEILLKGIFFIRWQEPEEKWFWPFEPFLKLKTAFCEYWTSTLK